MDKYRLRRAILSAVEASEPGLATAEDVAAYPLIRMGAVPLDKIMAEISGLVDHGYIVNAKPGREPLLRLSGTGRDQLNQEADLDEYVWDSMASKFHH